MSNVSIPHREKTLCTPSAFAIKKKVTRQAVWNQIRIGNITPVHIGTGKDVYIDWKEYSDFTFDKNKKNNSK